MTALSKEVRQILDASGKKDGKIFASSDLNEYTIEEMLNNGAEIDMFGVGTELILSKDAPTLGGIYKLSQLQKNGKIIPKLKLSKDKCTYPGDKQVYRVYKENGEFDHDVLGLRGEFDRQLEALLVPVMKSGKLVYELPELSESQKYCRNNISRLPQKFRQIATDQSYRVEISPQLEKLTAKVSAKYGVADEN
jgi:nicotinate phosphoribosyltransferase